MMDLVKQLSLYQEELVFKSSQVEGKYKARRAAVWITVYLLVSNCAAFFCTCSSLEMTV